MQKPSCLLFGFDMMNRQENTERRVVDSYAAAARRVGSVVLGQDKAILMFENTISIFLCSVSNTQLYKAGSEIP